MPKLRYSEKPTVKPKRDPGGAYAKPASSLKSYRPTQSGVRQTSLPKGGRKAR